MGKPDKLVILVLSELGPKVPEIVPVTVNVAGAPMFPVPLMLDTP